MVAFHSSALDGVAANPALPTPLLLRLLRSGVGEGPGGSGEGHGPGGIAGPPRQAVQRAGLPGTAVALILAHPDPRVRIDFALSAGAEPGQRARLADDPIPKVRAALAYGPEWHDPRTTVPPLPYAMCARLLDDPEPSVRTALLESPHLAPPFTASLATHHEPAARLRAVRTWERLTPGERSALSTDPDPGVRRAAALRECGRDARLTTELLQDPKSAAEALRRGLLVRADAERYVAERTHLAALAENPSLPPDLVERLAIDPDEDVRLGLPQTRTGGGAAHGDRLHGRRPGPVGRAMGTGRPTLSRQQFPTPAFPARDSPRATQTTRTGTTVGWRSGTPPPRPRWSNGSATTPRSGRVRRRPATRGCRSTDSARPSTTANWQPPRARTRRSPWTRWPPF
ncbi:hypothetical protein [Streptomyces sp. NPDC054865]